MYAETRMLRHHLFFSIPPILQFFFSNGIFLPNILLLLCTHLVAYVKNWQLPIHW